MHAHLGADAPRPIAANATARLSAGRKDPEIDMMISDDVSGANVVKSRHFSSFSHT